jgi:hypothetical protein
VICIASPVNHISHTFGTRSIRTLITHKEGTVYFDIESEQRIVENASTQRLQATSKLDVDTEDRKQKCVTHAIPDPLVTVVVLVCDMWWTNHESNTSGRCGLCGGCEVSRLEFGGRCTTRAGPSICDNMINTTLINRKCWICSWPTQ